MQSRKKMLSVYHRATSDMIRVCERKNMARGVNDLYNLRKNMIYWAPEVLDHNFWYGNGSVSGILDICNANYQDVPEIKDIMDPLVNGVNKSS